MFQSMGVPGTNHPFIEGLSITSHPAIGVPPMETAKWSPAGMRTFIAKVGFNGFTPAEGPERHAERRASRCHQSSPTHQLSDFAHWGTKIIQAPYSSVLKWMWVKMEDLGDHRC
jgi:hypothetical protein